MIRILKIFFGYRGTWFWACRQMKEGKTVYRLRDSGVVFFTYDKGRRKIKAMIDWGRSEPESEWGISMEDVYATDFMLWHERIDYSELHRQSQMKCDSKSLKPSQLKKHLKSVTEPLKEGATKSEVKLHMGSIMGPAPKPIKPTPPNPAIEIQQYMKNSPHFKEQVGSMGKRFTYAVDKVDVAYIWFKYGLNGWALIFYESYGGHERYHIDSVDKLKSVLNIKSEILIS